MPVERLIYQDAGFQQIGVSLENDELIEAIRPLAQAELIQTASLYFPPSLHTQASCIRHNMPLSKPWPPNCSAAA